MINEAAALSLFDESLTSLNNIDLANLTRKLRR